MEQVAKCPSTLLVIQCHDVRAKNDLSARLRHSSLPTFVESERTISKMKKTKKPEGKEHNKEKKKKNEEKRTT